MLLAAPFDLERLAVTGPEAVVLEGVRTEAEGVSPQPQAVFSRDGTLVYAAGASAWKHDETRLGGSTGEGPTAGNASALVREHQSLSRRTIPRDRHRGSQRMICGFRIWSAAR